MRARIIGSGILLGLATAGLAAPAALATPGEGAEVFIAADGSPQAGEHIEVFVRCYGQVGQPESPVLTIGELQEIDSPADIPTYRAPATINADTTPGDYQVTATCDGETLTWTFTVMPAAGQNDPGDDQQVTRTPRGAPETGAGTAGEDPTALVAAAGLAGAGGLAGLAAVVIRRRRAAD